MATLVQVNVVINDTGTPALAQDDATLIISRILTVLKSNKVSVVYAATAPHLTATVT